MDMSGAYARRFLQNHRRNPQSVCGKIHIIKAYVNKWLIMKGSGKPVAGEFWVPLTAAILTKPASLWNITLPPFFSL